MPDTIEGVRLDRFDLERDATLVSAWMCAPHVSRWWGDPVKALGEVLERPNGGGDVLIVADEVPVGYVRWQKPTRAELDAAGLQEVPDDTTMDIDIAIGEPDYIGLGVGSRAIRLLVKDLAAGSRHAACLTHASTQTTRPSNGILGWEGAWPRCWLRANTLDVSAPADSRLAISLERVILLV